MNKVSGYYTYAILEQNKVIKLPQDFNVSVNDMAMLEGDDNLYFVVDVLNCVSDDDKKVLQLLNFISGKDIKKPQIVYTQHILKGV